MSLQSSAEEYFSTLNSMASRLHTDMTETKLAYEDLWNNLKYKEQQQILSESIIKPEVCLRYASVHPEMVEEKYAVKLVVDDNCSYYRDEHSAPFSFKTQSQRDLTIFNKSEEDIREQPVILSRTTKEAEKLKPNALFEVEDNATTEATQFFPKTGLDLLDNW